MSDFLKTFQRVTKIKQIS